MKKIILIPLLALILLLSIGCSEEKADTSAYDYYPQKEKITYSDGNRTRIVKYTYDEKGNVTEELIYRQEAFFFIPYYHLSNKRTYTYTYDEMGRFVECIDTNDYHAPPFSITGEDGFSKHGKYYDYDQEGRLIKEGYIILETGERAGTNWKEYIYDEYGNLVKEHPHFGEDTVYTYDENNRLIRKEPILYHRTYTDYFYDEQGRTLYTVTTNHDAGPIGKNQPLVVTGYQRTEYIYDSYGRLVKKLFKTLDPDQNLQSTATTVYSDFVKIKK